MIKEIYNFTSNLIEDTPEVTQLKLEPQKGLYVFIDINDNGDWTNIDLIKGKDYDYYDGKNKDILLWKDCVRFQEATNYISMNKVKAFDSKQKIHSCSPFAIAFNFNFSETDKQQWGLKKNKIVSEEEKKELGKEIRDKRLSVVRERLSEYKKNALAIYQLNKIDVADLFSTLNEEASPNIQMVNAFYSRFEEITNRIKVLPEFQNLTEKDYLKVFLRSIPIELQENLHNKYIEDNLLNGEELAEHGVLGFLTSYSSKKIFTQHKTSSSVKGISYRFTKSEALVLHTFEQMWKRKCFPNPLPIVIDRREINKEIVKIFNEQSEPIQYKELLRLLFDRTKEDALSKYYLLNYRNTKDGMVLNDFDFIPLFRYKFETTLVVENVTEAGIYNDKIFEKDKDDRIDNIFDFERIVLSAIFNNSLVKIKDDKYSTHYFGDIDSKYVSGGDSMWQLVIKYRKAFYDYVYKSKTNAITAFMFEDMMLQSILVNILQDEINSICKHRIQSKINIWFSLYSLFNNNKKENIMASNVTALKLKMKTVARGEANIETPEEFAFGAGQLASYLIDRSAASNKTYALLEPYLQKSNAAQVQDALAQTIAVYKHDINVYKGNFELLAAQVLTYDDNGTMKPLLKYFLAGCFCPCAIYEKREQPNNNNQ